jgi:hypothetical protein
MNKILQKKKTKKKNFFFVKIFIEYKQSLLKGDKIHEEKKVQKILTYSIRLHLDLKKL